MPTRIVLLSVHVGPDLRGRGALRMDRSATGVWTIQNHQGQLLASLFTPGIPDDEIKLIETSLAVEIVRVIK